MNTRLLEARELLNRIKLDNQQFEVRRAPDALSPALRGLMFVSLYGAIEYTVTHGTQSFIGFLCGLKISTVHLEHALHTIALNSQLTSARDAGENRKWETRRAIFSEMASKSICDIPDTVFGSFLHNVYPKTISEIFLCLGIKAEVTAVDSDIGYLQEITEKRNAVAHGRETASDIGQGVTIQDLETRLNAAYSICSHFLDTIEEHGTHLRFIRSQHRAHYRQNTGTSF